MGKLIMSSLLIILPPILASQQVVFDYPASTYVPPPKKLNPGFVTIKPDETDGMNHFYLGEQLFDFRGFNAPTLLDGSVYETADLLDTIAGLGTPVTRTYTLTVSNAKFGGRSKDSKSHILGWNFAENDWIYNEDRFVQIDRVLDLASQRGVKLIFPIINQDYGEEETDFVGNHNDLIRHRFNITSYTLANSQVDFFTNQEMRVAFKKIVYKLITRTNTFNGKRYGEDDTILAWETGNEMNWGRENNTIHDRPAPAEWTIDIAQLIKFLAPNTLVMDGSFSRNPNEISWPVETLRSEYVDVFSYHLYGDGDLKYYDTLRDQILEAGKTLVIGEHGFYSAPGIYEYAYDLLDCPGALIWSIRAHNEIGGFTTHSEGNNIYSYHAPGWARQTSDEFDTQELPIVRSTFEASYDIINQLTPLYPVPGEPYPFFANNTTHSGLAWKGASWAKYYEIFAVGGEGGTFVQVATHVLDNSQAGTAFVALDPKMERIDVPDAPAVPIQSQRGWEDLKWSGSQPTKQIYEDSLKKRTTTSRRDSLETTALTQLPVSRAKTNHPIPQGPGWYIVRGISVNGYPGPFSKPTYISII